MPAHIPSTHEMDIDLSRELIAKATRDSHTILILLGLLIIVMLWPLSQRMRRYLRLPWRRSAQMHYGCSQIKIHDMS